MQKIALLPRDMFKISSYELCGPILTVTMSFDGREHEVNLFRKDFEKYLTDNNRLFFSDEVLVCSEVWQNDRTITIEQYFDDARDWNENYLLSDLKDFIVYAAGK